MKRDDYSQEAVGMAAGFFLMPKASLTFQRPWILSESARKGIQELEDKGLIVMDEGDGKTKPTTWRNQGADKLALLVIQDGMDTCPRFDVVAPEHRKAKA